MTAKERETGTQTGDGIDQQEMCLYIDTGNFCRNTVSPDHINVAAKYRLIQHKSKNQCSPDEIERQIRDTCQRS